jgi:hypothetical protein
MSNTDEEYIKDNKKNYDDFKIIKNKLVIIPSKSITETNILPIITNISYNNENVKLDNYIYHYLQKNTMMVEKNNLELNNIIKKNYRNIIIYQYSYDGKYKNYIINDFNIENLLKDDSKIYNSLTEQNNFEEYYLKYKGENKGEEEKYIRFKIFISLIIISIDDDNLIIFDYYKKSPLNILQNLLVKQDVPITNTEFENLNKLVITKAIYEDNPFEYLSDPPQS